MRPLLFAAAFIPALMPAAAHAESLNVSTGSPAPYGDVTMLYRMAVEPFDGEDGLDLARAVEQRLSQLNDRRGDAFFEILDARAADRADGVVTGAAKVTVDESRYKRTIRECIDKDVESCEDIDKEDVEIGCRRRNVRLDASIRIVRVRDGRLIHSRTAPRNDEVNWCRGDDEPADVETIVRNQIDSVASELTSGFVPSFGSTAERIREDRKSLPKPDEAFFKAAIKATKRNPQEACRMFGELASRYPDYPSLIFNQGVCAEFYGDRDAAEQFYRRMPITGKKKEDAPVRYALGRIASWRAAMAQDEERNAQLGR